MSRTKQTRRVTPALNEMHHMLLEMLPGALFVVDDNTKIVYANARARTMLCRTRGNICGQSFWHCAPHLVSLSLYQAIQRTKQTHEPTEVAYVSPATNLWLRVSLSSIPQGLSLFFQEYGEPQPFHGVNRNEQMYRDLLESFADGVTILTPDGLILDINWRPLVDAHLQREEVVGTPFADLPAWSSNPDVQEHLRAAIMRASTGETVRFEARIRPRTDLDLDILMTITSHRDINQQVEYLICTGRDITERKQAEDEQRTLVDALPQFVWLARPDGSITYNNQRLIDYLAMTHEQAEGDGWMAAVHPDERPRVWKAWQTSIQTGELYEVEHRLRDGTSGAYRWFLVRGVPQRNAQGVILHWVGACTDIEERKHTEQQLNESRESLRVLAEMVPQLVWTKQPNGQFEYTNQRWCDYTGLTLEQLQSDTWAYLPSLHPDDREGNRARWRHALDTGAMFECEQRLRNAQTGEYRWFLVRALPVRNEAGQIVKWFGTSTDIEDQKRVEDALRRSQERASALMNSSIIGIFVAEDDQVVEANETYLRMTGYTRDDLQKGRINWVRMTPPEYALQTQQARQELAVSHHVTRYEKEYFCKDGSRLPVVVGGVALHLKPLQVIGFMLDNSAHKELEQRKDAFISMASHELRNPLTALKLQTSLLHRQLARQDTLDQVPALASMETQINKVSRLVEELLDVSKIQAGRLEYVREMVDLDALLQEITDMMQQTNPSHRILVHGIVGTKLIGDPDRLGQVFINLISNAIKYSPDAEIVEIDLSTSKDVVIVQVRDHGLGIPREQRDKIFERFYRVSGSRQKVIPGLGMGLYIVSEIVKGHGGTITVESIAGKGSTFTVTLPR